MTADRHILSGVPNGITVLNLCAGSMAVFMAIQGEPGTAALLIAAASVFDFLDGLAARLLHAYSAIGRQLDSLADVISFGLAPAAILWCFMTQPPAFPGAEPPLSEACLLRHILSFSPLIIPVAGAFRLAKFNIDTRQNEHFSGLPIPANALFFASLAAVITWGENQAVHDIILSPWFLSVMIVLFSALMVSKIPMFSLKWKHLKWQGNRVRYLFIGFCPVMILIFRLNALPLIPVGYILFSIAAAAGTPGRR